MVNILFYDESKQLSSSLIEQVSTFLHRHLESYGDPLNQIREAIQYALWKPTTDGGFVAIAWNKDEIVGACVVNHTGMESYIPENLLVYIAIHKNVRGQGLGKQLIKACINQTKGSFSLHVEPDNPALFLYKSIGFTNKYLEMRLERKEMG